MTRSKSEVISSLMDPGIIAVIRARNSKEVHPLTEALLAGGVIAIEITMTTPNAIELIRELRNSFGNSALIGVGTVLNASVCRQATDAGAHDDEVERFATVGDGALQ